VPQTLGDLGAASELVDRGRADAAGFATVKLAKEIARCHDMTDKPFGVAVKLLPLAAMFESCRVRHCTISRDLTAIAAPSRRRESTSAP